MTTKRSDEYPLYAPVIDKADQGWQDKANCQSIDVNSFFPEDRGHPYPIELKRICGNCSVQKECLNYAVKYRVQGYWAGTTEIQRRALKRHLVK